ncbi:HNH endonuclease family protein, partial [Cylindrospermopsis raciborskii]
MDVFDLFEHKTINDETVLKVLNLIESYAFRKKLVDSSTQSLNKFFFGLAKEIKKEDNWQKNYFDIMAFTIKSKSGNLKFPTDDEFIQTLTYKDIYKLNKKNKYFLLENLENYNSPYQTDVQELTIEHIMPQKLTQEWKSALGNNYKEIHDKYLHTLGNLVLTAKNSNLSNKDFKDKQKIDFENSKLRLGYDLKDVKE